MLDTLQNLMRPPAGMDFDFSQPPGEPALRLPAVSPGACSPTRSRCSSAA